MQKVLILPRDNGICFNYRIKPYYSITSDIEFVFSNEISNEQVEDKTINAVLLQRPDHPICPTYITQMKKASKTVVVETDDDLSIVEGTNSNFEYFRNGIKHYVESLKLADHIHVSTPELATFKKCVVFPNAINLAKYNQSPLPKIAQVGWFGGTSHTASLELIKPAIQELINNSVKVLLCGNVEWLYSIFKPHPNLITQAWDKVNPHLPYSQVEVNLAPLTNTTFSQKKSELRLLESGAWSIPSVSSSVSPYIRFNNVSGGANTLIKKEKARYWVEEVMKLLNNEELRKEKGRLSRKAVEEHYDLNFVNNRRLEWWKKILK